MKRWSSVRIHCDLFRCAIVLPMMFRTRSTMMVIALVARLLSSSCVLLSVFFMRLTVGRLWRSDRAIGGIQGLGQSAFVLLLIVRLIPSSH